MTATRRTLVGVATGTPDGGVAVVRLSGTRAEEIATALCGSLPPPRRLGARAIGLRDAEPEHGLVVLMPGPGSFTGEDVVELHVHAGARNVQAVVDACLAQGATAAGPGDFTRRAFAHGRLSLDQAEGIAAVIGAQTDEALAQARRLAAGELGRDVERLREAVLELRAEVEANLDFPEDVDPSDVARWRDDLQQMRERLRRWVRRFESGRRARERARVVLAGPPNAGKSSLFNALLGRPRAIVSETPGTTRDYVEAELTLGRHAAWLVDTAGLRTETGDAIERAGIELSEDQLAGADVVVWVEAADTACVPAPSCEAEIVRVETKRDLGQARPSWVGVTLIGPTPQGVDTVTDALHGWFSRNAADAWIGLARHKDRAAEAADELDAAADLLNTDEHLELAAFRLAAAERRLGEITGRSQLGPIAAEVLDRIFARFCIGK